MNPFTLDLKDWSLWSPLDSGDVHRARNKYSSSNPGEAQGVPVCGKMRKHAAEPWKQRGVLKKPWTGRRGDQRSRHCFPAGAVGQCRIKGLFSPPHTFSKTQALHPRSQEHTRLFWACSAGVRGSFSFLSLCVFFFPRGIQL